MKKIFILTGEPSGDKLASQIIKKLKTKDDKIQYLCLGGENLKNLGIKSIKNLKDVTFLGFTKVITNIFKIKRNINETVKQIIEFDPDILFSVDSPDFTLRVAKMVKNKSPKIISGSLLYFELPNSKLSLDGIEWQSNKIAYPSLFFDSTNKLYK